MLDHAAAQGTTLCKIWWQVIKSRAPAWSPANANAGLSATRRDPGYNLAGKQRGTFCWSSRTSAGAM